MMVLRATMYPSCRVWRNTRSFAETAGGRSTSAPEAVSTGTSPVSSITMTSASASPTKASDPRHSRSEAGRFLVTTPIVRRAGARSGVGKDMSFAEGSLVYGERRLRRPRPAHVADAAERSVGEACAQHRLGKQTRERIGQRAGIARRHDQSRVLMLDECIRTTGRRRPR